MIVVSEPSHFLGAVMKCPDCGRLLEVTWVGATWEDGPDPDDGTPNQFVFGRLSDGALVRLWRRG